MGKLPEREPLIDAGHGSLGSLLAATSRAGGSDLSSPGRSVLIANIRLVGYPGSLQAFPAKPRR